MQWLASKALTSLRYCEIESVSYRIPNGDFDASPAQSADVCSRLNHWMRMWRDAVAITTQWRRPAAEAYEHCCAELWQTSEQTVNRDHQEPFPDISDHFTCWCITMMDRWMMSLVNRQRDKWQLVHIPVFPLTRAISTFPSCSICNWLLPGTNCVSQWRLLVAAIYYLLLERVHCVNVLLQASTVKMKIVFHHKKQK